MEQEISKTDIKKFLKIFLTTTKIKKIIIDSVMENQQLTPSAETPASFEESNQNDDSPTYTIPIAGLSNIEINKRKSETDERDPTEEEFITKLTSTLLPVSEEEWNYFFYFLSKNPKCRNMTGSQLRDACGSVSSVILTLLDNAGKALAEQKKENVEEKGEGEEKMTNEALEEKIEKTEEVKTAKAELEKVTKELQAAEAELEKVTKELQATVPTTGSSNNEKAKAAAEAKAKAEANLKAARKQLEEARETARQLIINAGELRSSDLIKNLVTNEYNTIKDSDNKVSLFDTYIKSSKEPTKKIKVLLELIQNDISNKNMNITTKNTLLDTINKLKSKDIYKPQDFDTKFIKDIKTALSAASPAPAPAPTPP